jgi:hypothetical protein
MSCSAGRGDAWMGGRVCYGQVGSCAWAKSQGNGPPKRLSRGAIMGRMPWIRQSNGVRRRWQSGDREGVSACGSKQFPARLEAADEKGTMGKRDANEW